MRREVDKERLREFLVEFGRTVRGRGRAYLTGGSTAIYLEWRGSTKDIDVSFDPEPEGLFEAIAEIKERLDINIEIESPANFVPPLPGWEKRSIFIGRFGEVDVFHFDPYTQALSKIERGHEQDRRDVEEMFRSGLVDRDELWSLFQQVDRAQMIRYTKIDPDGFTVRVRRITLESEDLDEA